MTVNELLIGLVILVISAFAWSIIWVLLLPITYFISDLIPHNSYYNEVIDDITNAANLLFHMTMVLAIDGFLMSLLCEGHGFMASLKSSIMVAVVFLVAMILLVGPIWAIGEVLEARIRKRS